MDFVTSELNFSCTEHHEQNRETVLVKFALAQTCIGAEALNSDDLKLVQNCTDTDKEQF
jgi:hypothetical protein